MTESLDLLKIAQADGRYSVDAYVLVCEAVQHVQEGRCSCQHVAAADLVDACLELAVRQFGLLAPLVLRGYGLACSADIGRVTFLMVAAGLLGKHPDDCIDDFLSGPDFSARARSLVGEGAAQA